MTQLLRVAQWNANGIINHKHEIETFIQLNNIDILLISETHIYTSTQFKIPLCSVYNAGHPDCERNPRGRAAVIIRNGIKHYELEKIEENHSYSSN